MGVVIVTGGTYGIGESISLVLAERGHQVVAIGLDSPQPSSIPVGSTKELVGKAHERGLTVDAREADVTEPAQVQDVVDFTLGKFGRIDALVNNAGIGPLGTIMDHSDELWDRVIDVNLKGPFLCCKAVLPHMIAAGGGAIVNTGSGAGWGKANMFAYAVSKGGIFAFSQSLAYDYFHYHIRVNTVCPGGGGWNTGMTAGRLASGRTNYSGTGTTVAGRPPRREEFGYAVAFLLSPEAEVISGAILDVNTFAMQGGPLPPPLTDRAGT